MRFVRTQESGSFHGGSRWQRGVHRPGATIDASRGASEALLTACQGPKRPEGPRRAPCGVAAPGPSSQRTSASTAAHLGLDAVALSRSVGRATDAGMFGAGTIIDVRNGSHSLPCGSSSGSPNPRETGWHRTSPTPGDHRVSPATATLAGSHLRPPGTSIPLWCACLRLGLSSGAFRLLTAPHSLPRRMNRRHGVKCISALEDPTQSPTPLSTDSPVQGRQVSSPTRP